MLQPTYTMPPGLNIGLPGLPACRAWRGVQDKVLSRAQELLQELDDAGARYEFDHFFSAGYDSPIRLIGRHNEVWVPAPTRK